MLRNYLGDEAFFKGLGTYLKARAFKSAEVQDLRLALEEVSGRDLTGTLTNGIMVPVTLYWILPTIGTRLPKPKKYSSLKTNRDKYFSCLLPLMYTPR
jgi:hypothetical protein